MGSGISGGWAAKELTEKGLKTLVLERGRHGAATSRTIPPPPRDPWETKYPRGRLPAAEMKAHYPAQQRTGYALTEYTQHFFVQDDEHPYTETQRFDWIRGYHVGGRSLMWARQSYRHSPIDFEANARRASASTGRSATPTSRPGTTTWSASSASAARSEGLAQLPDGVFQPPMEMNCVEKDLKAQVRGAASPSGAITIGRVAHLTAPTEEQLALGRGKCQHRNMCIRGCPFGAYFSSNSATLVAAERTGNMTLRPNSIVTSLIYRREGGQGDGRARSSTPTTGQESEFYAEVIFLCASALNTAWIMLNSTSTRFPNGFGNDSDQVGRNIMDHHLGVGAAAEVAGLRGHVLLGPPAERHLHPALPQPRRRGHQADRLPARLRLPGRRGRGRAGTASRRRASARSARRRSASPAPGSCAWAASARSCPMPTTA